MTSEFDCIHVGVVPTKRQLRNARRDWRNRQRELARLQKMDQGVVKMVEAEVARRDAERARGHKRPDPQPTFYETIERQLSWRERFAATQLITLNITANISRRSVTASYGDASGSGEMSDRRAEAARRLDDVLGHVGTMLYADLVGALFHDEARPIEAVRKGLELAAWWFLDRPMEVG